jgi:GT2 family glycosyltransferase
MRGGLARVGLRAAPLDPWLSYLKSVEPGVAAHARVHRFAQVPIVAGSDTPAAAVAVWVDGAGAGAERTWASVRSGSRAPAALLRGPLTSALAETRAEFVLLARAGDVLAPLALERFGQGATLAADARVVTCDEDRLDAGLRRHAPIFRPGPSPDHWLACDDTSRTLLVRREAAAALVSRLSSEHAWRHELAIRLAGNAGETAAHVPILLSHMAASTPPPPVSPEVVLGMLREREPVTTVEVGNGVRRVRRPISGEPSVELVICLRDRAELLERCVESVLATTDYPRLRLALVDNGSREPATAALLARYAARADVRVLRDPGPFNFAALNNTAARSSTADVLVFLNNDTEAVQADWISLLLQEALRPEVGAVAPMLLYGHGEVQHAGAAIGLHGYAGHPFAGLNPATDTPFGRADGGTRNWLAVTAACLMIERAKFRAVGGFDESFIVAGNDVDLCLRLTAAGRRSLCVPEAVMVHDESRSRGSHIDPADFVRSEQSYGDFRTLGDPFYNPNLTLDATDCSVRAAGRTG